MGSLKFQSMDSLDHDHCSCRIPWQHRQDFWYCLNSIVNKKFPFTTQQVKDCIVVAITSDGAASAQAEIFKKANDYHF